MTDIAVRMQALYEVSPVLIAAFDADDRLAYANAAYRSAFFLERGETPLWRDLIHRNYLAGRGTIVHDADIEAWLTATLGRRGKMAFRAFETDLADGRWLWMTETVDAAGWMLCVASDITSLKAGDRMLRQERDFALRASYTDDLTGIANRRFAMGRLTDMLRSAAERGVDAGCFALLDLDDFKRINDRFGHDVGDLVLCHFTRQISALLRRTDCFGRLGGEEFCLVMPHATPEAALAAIDHMREHLRWSSAIRTAPDFRYGFSSGVAAVRPGEGSAEIYSRADRALYAAKNAGRGRSMLAQ